MKLDEELTLTPDEVRRAERNFDGVLQRAERSRGRRRRRAAAGSGGLAILAVAAVVMLAVTGTFGSGRPQRVVTGPATSPTTQVVPPAPSSEPTCAIGNLQVLYGPNLAKTGGLASCNGDVGWASTFAITIPVGQTIEIRTASVMSGDFGKTAASTNPAVLSLVRGMNGTNLGTFRAAKAGSAVVTVRAEFCGSPKSPTGPDRQENACPVLTVNVIS